MKPCFDIFICISRYKLMTLTFLFQCSSGPVHCVNSLWRRVCLSVRAWWSGRKRKGGSQKILLVLFQRKHLTQTIISVLQGAPSSWQWQGRAEDALYCGLYPRAWTVYNIPKVEDVEIWKERSVIFVVTFRWASALSAGRSRQSSLKTIPTLLFPSPSLYSPLRTTASGSSGSASASPSRTGPGARSGIEPEEFGTSRSLNRTAAG